MPKVSEIPSSETDRQSNNDNDTVENIVYLAIPLWSAGKQNKEYYRVCFIPFQSYMTERSIPLSVFAEMICEAVRNITG